MTKRLYIINPKGNGGAGLKAWVQFTELWKEDINNEDVIFTKRLEHASEIAFKATGYKTIVSVGGDGTVNEVIQGVLKNKSKPSLALIPAGTGNDIGRNIGIFSVKDAAKALALNIIKKYDLLISEYGNEKRHSFLTSNFGFSANHRVKPWMKRLLGPTLAYYLATLQEIVLFQPWDMTLEWESGKFSGKTTIVLVANVEKSSGGSMVIGPGATPVDGIMTVTIVPYRSKFDCLVNKFPKTPTGKIIEEPDVKFFHTKEIVVKSNPATDLDIDGDLHGSTPATVKILPKAITMISLSK